MKISKIGKAREIFSANLVVFIQYLIIQTIRQTLRYVNN